MFQSTFKQRFLPLLYKTFTLYFSYLMKNIKQIFLLLIGLLYANSIPWCNQKTFAKYFTIQISQWCFINKYIYLIYIIYIVPKCFQFFSSLSSNSFCDTQYALSFKYWSILSCALYQVSFEITSAVLPTYDKIESLGIRHTRSFIYNMNSKGQSIVPWGTPTPTTLYSL